MHFVIFLLDSFLLRCHACACISFCPCCCSWRTYIVFSPPGLTDYFLVYVISMFLASLQRHARHADDGRDFHRGRVDASQLWTHFRDTRQCAATKQNSALFVGRDSLLFGIGCFGFRFASMMLLCVFEKLDYGLHLTR
jgi:hypothetical protein